MELGLASGVVTTAFGDGDGLTEVLAIGAASFESDKVNEQLDILKTTDKMSKVFLSI